MLEQRYERYGELPGGLEIGVERDQMDAVIDAPLHSIQFKDRYVHYHD